VTNKSILYLFVIFSYLLEKWVKDVESNEYLKQGSTELTCFRIYSGVCGWEARSRNNAVRFENDCHHIACCDQYRGQCITTEPVIMEQDIFRLQYGLFKYVRNMWKFTNMLEFHILSAAEFCKILSDLGISVVYCF